MLKKLRIQNFKAWQDTQEINLAPLTLLFGTNSSGKSSIGQFLTMLSNTAQSANPVDVFKTSEDELGSFKDMVHERDESLDISFMYEWSYPTSSQDSSMSFPGSAAYSDVSFEATVGHVSKTQSSYSQTVHLKRFSYIHEEQTTTLLRTNDGTYEVTRHPKELETVSHSSAELTKPYKFFGFPDNAFYAYKDVAFMRNLQFTHETFLKSIYYLGPMRANALRNYYWANGQSIHSVGKRGENTVPLLMSSKDKYLVNGFQTSVQTLEEVVAQSLHDMGLIEDFKIEQATGNADLYKVLVQTKGTKSHVDLVDVGFGVTQVLPVLAQMYFAPKDSVLIIEQPEIHLHPSAQAALADVMINVLKSKAKRPGSRINEERNIQLIIETHSEHFLTRLLRRIAEETTITHRDVAAYVTDLSKPNPIVVNSMVW